MTRTCMDTTLRLEFPGTSNLHSRGIKRKSNTADGTEDSASGFSLMLGLGHSPCSSDNSKMSSATVCTILSAKDANEGNSSDRGSKFQLHFGNDPCPKRPALATADKLASKAVCDLQLSLSSAPSASIITNASLFRQHDSIVEASVSVDALPPVDEGSISSRWKSGTSSLLTFNSLQAGQQHFINWGNPIKSDSLSTMTNFLSTCMPCQAMKNSKSSVNCTSGITNTQIHRSNTTKICQFQGCTKGARGASGLCIAHGGGRRCQREGCHKGAEGRTVYCKAHGGGRRCHFLGCTKSAEGRTDYCIAHGGGRRCSHEGCTKAARGKSGLCIRHGGGKRCQKENCTKSAEGYSGFCISHGGGRRCQFPACTKGAQGSTMFCKAHGGGKRCTAPGCTKGAEGSTPYCKGHGGGKRCSFHGGGVCPKSVHGGTKFCVAHGGGKRCAAPDCTRSARGRTNFCVRHGGGKRCKEEGCAKSAQGRSDYCKAHGGGTRCSWGQVGSGFGIGAPPCECFARGKIGLCTSHSSMVQEGRVHGAGSLPNGASANQTVQLSETVKAKEVAVEHVFPRIGHHGRSFVGWNCVDPQFVPQVIPQQPSANALLEGRVHGGGLMAMLASGADFGNQTCDLSGAGPSQWKDEGYAIPQKWI